MGKNLPDPLDMYSNAIQNKDANKLNMARNIRRSETSRGNLFFDIYISIYILIIIVYFVYFLSFVFSLRWSHAPPFLERYLRLGGMVRCIHIGGFSRVDYIAQRYTVPRYSRLSKVYGQVCFSSEDTETGVVRLLKFKSQ